MYKLYWAPSTAAFAPQAVLEEAGAAYVLEPVDLAAGAQRSDSYLALNPAGYVPTLVTDDGQVLTESAAIMLALCERHPEAGLLPPAGDVARGQFYRWLFYLTNHVQATYKRYYYSDRYSTDTNDAPRIKDRARAELLERWRPMDAHLAKNGPFVLGAEFCAGDIFLVMLATWFDPREALFTAFPHVERCVDRAAERPAIRRVLDIHGGL